MKFTYFKFPVFLLLFLSLGTFPTWANTDRVSVHQIRDWRAPSEREIIIEVRNKHKYRAVMFNRCFGLRTAETVAFVTKGGNSLDAFSSVVLPDGTRCHFKSFIRQQELPPIPIQDENIELTTPDSAEGQ